MKKVSWSIYQHGIESQKSLERFLDYKKIPIPYFGSIMSMNIFELIGRMLRISDKEAEVARGQPGFDPWIKVRKVLDAVNKNSKAY